MHEQPEQFTLAKNNSDQHQPLSNSSEIRDGLNQFASTRDRMQPQTNGSEGIQLLEFFDSRSNPPSAAVDNQLPANVLPEQNEIEQNHNRAREPEERIPEFPVSDSQGPASAAAEIAPEKKQGRETSKSADGDSKIVPFGNSEIKFNADGTELQSIKLPTGQVIERNKDTGRFSAPSGDIDSVKFNKETGAIEINWEPKNGVTEKSFVRKNGVETVYDKPQTFLGVDNVKSIDLSTSKDGKYEVTLRTGDDEFHRFDVLSKPGEKLKIDHESHAITKSPSALSEKELDKGASEIARLLHKNGNNFGSQADRDYVQKVFSRYAETGQRGNFEDAVNKEAGKNPRFDVVETTVRSIDSKGTTFGLINRKNGGKETDSIVLAEPRPKNR